MRSAVVEESSELLALGYTTRSEQKRIEVLMRVGHRFDLDHYHRLLIKLILFLNAWEPRVVQVLPEKWQDWFICRRRSVLLKHDLSMQGINAIGEINLHRLDLDNPSAVWGSVYAMESMALDSQRISAWLQRGLEIGPHNGGAYFCNSGDKTGVLWRELHQVLRAEVKGPRSQTQACFAATQTLRALMKVLRHDPKQQSKTSNLEVPILPVGCVERLASSFEIET